jgi:hypothetical protein
MATDSTKAAPEEAEDDVQWASQEAYQEQTAETKDVVLPDGQMKVRVAVMQPTKFASLIDEYGITDLAKDMGDLDPDADLADAGDVDLADAGDVDLDEVDQEDLDELDDRFRVILFFRDVIMPQVVKPERVHWADPDHIGNPGWFDLADLTDQDRTFLIGAVTGQDPETLLDEAQDRAESFQR